MDDLELAYVHDGSLEGLLTAVFLAFERKEYPSDVSASCSFMPRLGQRIVRSRRIWNGRGVCVRELFAYAAWRHINAWLPPRFPMNPMRAHRFFPSFDTP